MELPDVPILLVLVALTGGSFFCALAEAALFSLGRWQVRRLQEAEAGKAGSRTARLARLLEQPEEVLSALSLANTLANGMLVVTGLALARQQSWNLWVTLGAVLAVVLFVGEILPKTLAVRSPEAWAVRVIPGVALLQTVTRPLRRLARAALEGMVGVFGGGPGRMAPVTDEEYRELLDMGVQQGALGHSEKEIIAELITLDRKCARDVMRPRATMAVASDDLSPEQLAAEARRLRHRRLPLYDETPDTIVGVLNVKQFLLDPTHGLDEAIEFPSFVPETMNLWQLFQALQRQKRSVAIVLDEFGSVAGVVRMEDILAEVLGDMTGEGAARGFV